MIEDTIKFEDRGNLLEVCYPEDFETQLSVGQAINSLSYYGFAFFDPFLSEHEHWLLSQINVQRADTMNVYADLPSLYKESDNFIKAAGLEPIRSHLSSELALLVSKIIRNVMALSGYDDCQVAIATYLKDPYYYPFWHVDKNHNELLGLKGDYSLSQTKKVFIFTLKGETTLYQKADQTIRNAFNEMANETSYVFGPSHFNYIPGQGLDKLFNVNNAISPSFTLGSVHFSGYEYGTIHSTPDTENRMILIISPGERSLIKSFKKHITEHTEKLLKEIEILRLSINTTTEV